MTMKRVIGMILVVVVVLTGIYLPVDKINACSSTELIATDDADAQRQLDEWVANRNDPSCHCLSSMPTGKPKRINIVVKGEKLDISDVEDQMIGYYDEKEFSNCSTVSVTKGFQLKMSLEQAGMYNEDYDDGFPDYLNATCMNTDTYRYYDENGNVTGSTYAGEGKLWYRVHTVHKDYNTVAKWTSSNPNVATVDAKGVVTGKKCGKTLITVEYDGQTTSIYVNVKENKYIHEKLLFPSYFNHYSWGTSFVGISSVSFDKKGNLVVVYTDKRKLSKKGKKKMKNATAYKVNYKKVRLYIKNMNGKKAVVATKMVKIKYNISKSQMRKGYCKNIKLKISKSALKMKKKDIDLRTAYVNYSIM